MNARCILWLAIVMRVLSLVPCGAAAEASYSERFSEALTNGQKGFMKGAGLVDTDNRGPALTNAPIPFGRVARGELGGIRLGMTMSDVVSVWGKPSSAYSRCLIGPRFWYGAPHRSFGDVSLSFAGDRLVVVAISGKTARHLVFENGLSGRATRADVERVIGAPALRDSKDLGLFNGQIAYRSGPFRIDFAFEDSARNSSLEPLRCVSVCLEAEAKKVLGH